eukprot:SAG25_NODE_295_length_10249_cov_5.144926_4_plen_64_part_00
MRDRVVSQTVFQAFLCQELDTASPNDDIAWDETLLAADFQVRTDDGMHRIVGESQSLRLFLSS